MIKPEGENPDKPLDPGDINFNLEEKKEEEKKAEENKGGEEDGEDQMDEEEAEEETNEDAVNNRNEKVFSDIFEMNSSVLLTKKNKYCFVKKEIDENMYECIVKTPKIGGKGNNEETQYLMLLPKD